jgi:hypothetical protein
MVRSAQDQKPHDTHTAPIAPGREPVFVLGVARRENVTSGSVRRQRKSYFGALRPDDRRRLLAQITGLVGGRFPDGRMSVPHRTRMWLARRRLRPAAG